MEIGAAYFKHLLSKKEKTDLTPRKLINVLKKQNYKMRFNWDASYVRKDTRYYI